MGKTLRRYLVREIGGAFFAGIAIFTSILFLVKAVALIEMIFARGVPAELVLRLLVAILPSFLEATLPMAFLLGIVVALGRMASDHETVALGAAGISIWQVLPSVMLLSVVVAAATLALSMTARPWGHREIERTAFEIAKRRASAAIRPRFFNTDFERMVVYVDRIERDTGNLVGVLLSDERGDSGRQAVFASRGRMGAHEDSGKLFLELHDGTSVSTRENATDYDVTSFRSLEVSLELRTATGRATRSDEPATLGLGDMLEDLSGADEKHASEAAIELHRRLGTSAAAIVLAMFGAALGFSASPASRGRAIAISLVTILAFYALLSIAVSMARAGTLPPLVSLWMPDAALAVVALWSLSRIARGLSPLPWVYPRASAAHRAGEPMAARGRFAFARRGRGRASSKLGEGRPA